MGHRKAKNKIRCPNVTISCNSSAKGQDFTSAAAGPFAAFGNLAARRPTIRPRSFGPGRRIFVLPIPRRRAGRSGGRFRLVKTAVSVPGRPGRPKLTVKRIMPNIILSMRRADERRTRISGGGHPLPNPPGRGGAMGRLAPRVSPPVARNHSSFRRLPHIPTIQGVRGG